MIKWIFKYGVVVFLFNTIFLAISITYSLGDQIFIGLMSLFSIALIINPDQIKNAIFHKAFSFLLLINVLNILYFLSFHSINDIQAIKYLFARGIQFSIISVSIYFHFNYYKTQFLDHIVYLVLFIIFLSLIIDPNIFTGRYSGIIWNPNMLSSFVTIAFAILLLKNQNQTRLNIFFLVVLLVVALATGSRGSLVGIILAFIFKYGLKRRNFLYAIIGFVFVLVIINLQLNTSINRLWEQFFNDRALQYKYAFESIYNKIYTGYGLDRYAYIDKSLVPIFLKGKIIGAHNGYLAILTQYGIIF